MEKNTKYRKSSSAARRDYRAYLNRFYPDLNSWKKFHSKKRYPCQADVQADDEKANQVSAFGRWVKNNDIDITIFHNEREILRKLHEIHESHHETKWITSDQSEFLKEMLQQTANYREHKKMLTKMILEPLIIEERRQRNFKREKKELLKFKPEEDRIKLLSFEEIESELDEWIHFEKLDKSRKDARVFQGVKNSSFPFL